MTDLHDTMEISHTSGEIIPENLEEALPNTELISQNMSLEEDQEISTNHMDLSVIMVMLHHTEVTAEDDIHLITEKVEVTSTSETNMIDQEENHAVLGTDITMTPEEVDRAPDVKEECLENIKDQLPDNLQVEMVNLSNAEDQHQEMAEMIVCNVEDVVVLATKQHFVRCFLFGEENLATVVSSTKEETATVPVVHT